MPAIEDSSSFVTSESADGVTVITLRRPPLNVLDLSMLGRLNAVLEDCQHGGTRVMLLTSGLARDFSAGVDVRDHRPDRIDLMLDLVRETARLMLTSGAVTIAAVRGRVLGGGLELALLCDLVLAADAATLGLPEISLAAFPPLAAGLLPEQSGWKTAMRMMLGESIDAIRAEALGLVTQVIKTDQLEPEARRLARSIATFSGAALNALLLATRLARSESALRRIDEAIAVYRRQVAGSQDAREGIDAFLEKRLPAWSHR